MKTKILVSDQKKINPKNLVPGKLYNYEEVDGSERGIILIAADDYCDLKFRVVELMGLSNKVFLWGEDPVFSDFIFTEFPGKLEISN